MHAVQLNWNELTILTFLPLCGFVDQLVEYRTGITEVMGSNPVEALNFFSGFFANYILLKLQTQLPYRDHFFTYIALK